MGGSGRMDIVDPVSGKDGVLKVARFARDLVRWSTGLLVLVFGWLKLNGLDFRPLANDLSANVLREF